MKKLVSILITLTIILPSFIYSAFAFSIAPPEFTCLDEFYAWAMLDMYSVSQHGDPSTIAEKNAIIDGFTSFAEERFWLNDLRENSVRMLIRVEDMFPTINNDAMRTISVEVNPYHWDIYQIYLENGINMWVDYDQNRHEITQYLPYRTRIKVSNILITISMPTGGNTRSELVEDHDYEGTATRLRERLFEDEMFRPLTDLFSEDDAIREAAEQELAQNVRENVIYFEVAEPRPPSQLPDDDFDDNDYWSEHNGYNCNEPQLSWIFIGGIVFWSACCFRCRVESVERC